MNELSEYDFTLPPELIAQHPLKDRTDARLMVVDRTAGTIRHFHIRDLPRFLKPTDTLVVNNTKVLPARLVGYRTKSGGSWEGLFVGFAPQGRWKIMSKARGKLQPGETISLRTSEDKVGFPLELEEKLDDGTWIVRPRTDEDSLKAMEQVGWVPIPPYIRGGKMETTDKQDYQTVFASEPGAIAAPTAGLHFTPSLLNEIEQLGVQTVPLTLHVGVGTFRPISVERLDEHVMHSEWGALSPEAAERINARRCASGSRTIAIGTTSVRVLEAACQNKEHRQTKGTLQPYSGEIDLFIRPPYSFKAVDVLLTNFHFPKSTLYVLVKTFGGNELIADAYAEAIRERYRFFSYGDAMIIIRY